MEPWLLVLLSISLCVPLAFVLKLGVSGRHKKKRLPPGPLAVPVLGNLLWLWKSMDDVEQLLRELHAKHGPIVTLRIGPRPSIFILDRNLAHKVLIQHGANFADRPSPPQATLFLSSNRHNITSSPYGPFWRLVRRNLISEILHPSRVRIYGHGRQWVLGLLSQKLRAQAESGDGIVVAVESFRFAMFCLLVLMCFGEKLDEQGIRDIEFAQRDLLLYASNLNIFSFAPSITKHLFRKRWATAFAMRRRQKELYAPLIKARKEHKSMEKHSDERFVYSYMDSLLDIELPEEGGRKLTDDELVVLSSEFLNAGTDTTSTALQWIMANLVKHPDVQAKVVSEIDRITGGGDGEINEEDLQKMPYVKAVVMEGLRRHPPAHFVLPHSVSEEIVIEGYVIPKDASINFAVAEMSWDDKVWEDPLEFKPERFLAGGSGDGVDITGSREIKMMPFGVGRRICPGLNLAMLHLEYFVANLVRQFEWKAVDGLEVDLSEKEEFTTVMKNPLRARLLPRTSK